jgi:polyphosphate kinase
MKRNLDKRVEVAFPVFDEDLRHELKHYLQTQLKDNEKGRILDADQKNEYNEQGIEKVRSQYLIYDYYKEMVNQAYQSSPPMKTH